MNSRADELGQARETLPDVCASSNSLAYISLQVAAREFESRFGGRIRFKRSLAAVISRQFLSCPSREAAEEFLRAALLANGLRLRTIDHRALVIER